MPLVDGGQHACVTKRKQLRACVRENTRSALAFSWANTFLHSPTQVLLEAVGPSSKSVQEADTPMASYPCCTPLHLHIQFRHLLPATAHTDLPPILWGVMELKADLQEPNLCIPPSFALVGWNWP